MRNPKFKMKFMKARKLSKTLMSINKKKAKVRIIILEIL